MSRENTERQYAYWLCRVPGVGNRTIARLLRACGSAEEVYGGGEEVWKKFMTQRQLEAIVRARAESEPARIYEELLRTDIRFVMQEDPEYPARLRNIPDAPFALFGKGRMPEEDILSVAVIGARDCSEYGRYIASELGKELGRRGVQVISGMARGIDGISQWAALEAGGVSYGVLGSGVDVCYPRENGELYGRLCGQGGILSSYPPGTVARPQNFPPRNRIVSGLADALVVIEARSRSGTLITVDMALEQGRDVYVVPGRVTDRLSDGCNRLLKQGAGVFLSPEDFLLEVESAWRGRRGNGAAAAEKTLCRNRKESPAADGGIWEPAVPPRLEHMEPELRHVYHALDLQPRSLEEIRERTAGEYTVQQLAAALMRLCVEGLAVQFAQGYFARRVT